MVETSDGLAGVCLESGDDGREEADFLSCPVVLVLPILKKSIWSKTTDLLGCYR